MTEERQNAERVETLVERGLEEITDTIPAQIFDAVEGYYARRGYRLQRFTFVSSGTYDATFTKQEGSL